MNSHSIYRKEIKCHTKIVILFFFFLLEDFTDSDRRRNTVLKFKYISSFVNVQSPAEPHFRNYFRLMQAWRVSRPEKQLTSKKNVVHQAKHKHNIVCYMQTKTLGPCIYHPIPLPAAVSTNACVSKQQRWILNTQASIINTIWKSAKAVMVSLALRLQALPWAPCL